MIETVKNAWKIPELRKKLTFVLFAIIIYRLGFAIYVPFVDTNTLANQFASLNSGNLLGYFNTLSGGGFATASIFAMSIYPYINSSIIIQLLQVAIPALERLAKEGGEEGKKTLQRITRCTTLVLAAIMADFLGKQRLPMIILDTSAVIKNRAMFSARGAGILGFSMFARDKLYALDENMQLDVDGLTAFLDKHQGEDIFLFGFTFMIWQHFCAELRRVGYQPDLSRGVLIHGGGWKKLADQHITTAQFKQELYETCGLTRVHDYYGMVEQTGTIYMECECGHLHAPVWSDVTIRRPSDFGVAQQGEKGLIQVSSLLPRSYPGHLLLTEDEGRILGEDDCPCGRKGKYFEIVGRIKRAEVRGCSDTYEQK